MRKFSLLFCVFTLLSALVGSAAAADEPVYDISLFEQGDPAHYGIIIADVTAMLNGQEPTYFAAGDELSTIYSMVAGSAYATNIGYAVIDIDGDGIDELLIGENPGDMSGTIFYNGFSIINDEVKELFNGSERNRWYLASDNTLINEGSNSAFNSGTYAYALEDGQLKFTEAVIYDSEQSNGPWFRVTDPIGEQVSISEGEASAFQNAHPYLNIELTPFVM